MENIKNEETLFTPKQVSKITGVEATLLLKWVNFFNIKTEWTQENQQGHRRYTKENIEEILELKKLIQEKKMNWDQAKTVFEGSELQFIVDEGKTRIEKTVEKILEKQEKTLENQENQDEFNKMLLTQLQSLTKLYEETRNELATTKEEMSLLKQENQEIKSLPVPDSISDDIWITRRRVEQKLRREARELWEKEPLEVRMIKKGWGRKEENQIKRADYIQDYIDLHIEERYREEIKRA